MSTFSDRLKDLREKHGMSVFDLSLAARIQEQNIRLWERGPRRPSDPDHIAALADALDTTTDYLITGKKTTNRPATMKEGDAMSKKGRAA